MAGPYDQEGQSEASRLRDEVEQLRTALEHADDEIHRLVEHRDRLLLRVAAQARDLHAINAAYAMARGSLAAETAERTSLELSRGQEEEELRVAFEELQVVTEELEVANTSLREANHELDARVQERTLAIAQREEWLRTATQVGRLGLWDWDVRTGRVHWSDEHFRMGGYAVGEVAPSYEAWAKRIHPDDRAGTEAALRKAMESRQDYEREFRMVHPDGSMVWLYSRGRFYYDEAGQPVRMVGAMIDTTERRQWEERQKVLVGELQHRTRNLMGMVLVMADKTARASDSLADFFSRFRDRIDALARVQGLLSRLNEHDRVTFDDLLRTELSAMNGGAERVTLDGPPGVRLRSSTVQTLAMALHELATNAVKYGALGQPQARLAVRWSLAREAMDDAPWLHIDWRESAVRMPSEDSGPRTGQGRELIERALPYQLSARTSYVLGPDGAHCTISMPVSASTAEADAHA